MSGRYQIVTTIAGDRAHVRLSFKPNLESPSQLLRTGSIHFDAQAHSSTEVGTALYSAISEALNDLHMRPPLF